MKSCSNCGPLPISAFNRRARSPDGLQPICRGCEARYRRAHRPEINAAQRHRYTRGAAESRLEQNRASKKRHPRAVREARARYVALDPERERERHRVKQAQRLTATPEKVRASDRLSKRRCAERRRTENARRRALKAGVTVEEVRPAVVLERADGLCGVCGERVDPADFHVDHVIPLARDGEHSYANCQPAHPGCNLRKGAMTA